VLVELNTAYKILVCQTLLVETCLTFSVPRKLEYETPTNTRTMMIALMTKLGGHGELSSSLVALYFAVGHIMPLTYSARPTILLLLF
jgi:hypothetical protein